MSSCIPFTVSPSVIWVLVADAAKPLLIYSCSPLPPEDKQWLWWSSISGSMQTKIRTANDVTNSSPFDGQQLKT